MSSPRLAIGAWSSFSRSLSLRRFCVDGSALVFSPADGGDPVRGAFDPSTPRELPAWARPPGVRVNA